MHASHHASHHAAARRFGATRFAWLAGAAFAALAALAGCSALPDKPARPLIYDFGPGALEPVAQNRMAPLPAMAIAEVDADGLLDSTAVLYRLGYGDANQLRPYALARWTMQPGQLLRQRVRAVLGQRRVVLNAEEAASQMRREGDVPYTLRLELEEFSHYFSSPTQSEGVVRVRATLVDSTAAGEVVVGQRMFVARQPAPGNDAPGGVRALAAASDAVVKDIAQWVNAIGPVPPRTPRPTR